MSEQKHGLTFEEHDELGIEVQTIHDRMVIIQTTLENQYKGADKDSRASKAIIEAEKIVKAIIKLKSNLEETLFADCPQEDKEKLLTIYYRAVREDHVRSPQPIRPSA